MESIQGETIVYYIDIDDIQNVANEEIERDLTKEEVDSIIDVIGENINWYDAISTAIASKHIE